MRVVARLSALALACATALHLAAVPAVAQTSTAPAGGTGFAASSMSDSEREAFRAEVRAYLMDHPEVIYEAVSELERRQQQAQADMDTTLVEINADDIFRDGHSWVSGNVEGDLTLVEFMDYRCGYCRRAQPVVQQLLNDDGRMRLVITMSLCGPAVRIHSAGFRRRVEKRIMTSIRCRIRPCARPWRRDTTSCWPTRMNMRSPDCICKPPIWREKPSMEISR